MAPRRFALILFMVFILGFVSIAVPLAAQETTFLSLGTDNINLQTGQEYEIRIQLIDAPDIWVQSAEIQFDPNLVYVIGTVAGSPVHQSDFFSPAESTVVIRNQVENQRQISYTISMLAPAESPSGSGIIGTFRIYPIAPGTTSLSFRKAGLTAITRDEQNNVESESVPFTPALLELNITGDPVDPPSEATATPTATATATVFVPAEGATREPTLVNVTLDPNMLQTPTSEVGPAEESGMSLPLMLALVVMVVGGIGTALVIIVGLRRRR